MASSLKEIKSVVKPELLAFQKHFDESMKSKISLLDKITKYIVKSKGKQVRPLFAILCAKMFGDIQKPSFIAASLIELLHTASLVHDDVVDNAHRRRSFFSINALWKNKIAVLVGDYLVSKGLLSAIDNEEFRILQIVSIAIREIMEGELLQIEKARKLDIDEAVYFEIIEKKTASLIAAACSAGAFSTTRDEAVAKKMYEFGILAGMAFQIKDDLLDYGSDDIGKPKGADLKDKKLTLPVIHVLSKATYREKRWIINTVKKSKPSTKEINKVMQFVRDKGGIAYADQLMRNKKDEAIALLNTYDNSEAKTALIDLLEFVVSRKK